MRRTSAGSCHAGDSTATANVSRLCPAARRTATARSNARDPGGGAFDVGGVDLTAGHDDDVFDPTAHHHVAGLSEVAQVTGVIPTMRILGRHKSADRGV